jgi:hypothetical protein
MSLSVSLAHLLIPHHAGPQGLPTGTKQDSTKSVFVKGRLPQRAHSVSLTIGQTEAAFLAAKWTARLTAG